MEKLNPTSSVHLYKRILLAAIVTAGLYLTSLHSYLLFHNLVEFFSIVVSFTIFILAWNTQQFQKNSYLFFIGVMYLAIAALDVLHTLAYKGMGVFPGQGANLPTQLWIASRYMYSLSLLVAPFFLNRKSNVPAVLITFGSIVALLVAAIFYWKIFPVCFIDGVGLTPFKKISEVIISIILGLSIFSHFRRRKDFEPDVFRLIILSIIVMVMMELIFATYIGVYDIANMTGHIFRLAANVLIFQAITVTGLVRPYNLLFWNLKQSEESLRVAHNQLEIRVHQRTAELAETNRDLQTEIVERKKAEQELKDYKDHLEELVEARTRELQQKALEQQAAQQALLRHSNEIEVHHYLMKGREIERLRIAREIHDGPLQELLGMKFLLQAVHPDAGQEQYEAALAETIELIQNQMAELRSICNELRPPTLIHFGVQKAIRAHADNVREKHPNLKIYLNVEGEDSQPVAEDVRLALFRIYQEAMNNILKHAGASEIFVELRQDDGQIELEIHDNGKGFDVPENWVNFARQGHLGLVGIMERVESVSGKLNLQSGGQSGTCLTVVIPLGEQVVHGQNESLK